MEFLITFFEGVLSFISPCLLPLLPVYISYLVGTETVDSSKTIKNAFAFVLGFTIVFVTLGAFAGTLGAIIRQHAQIFNIFAGGLVILFGLNFIGVINLGFAHKSSNFNLKNKASFWGSILFGIVFAISWSPCVGSFFGSALMLAATYKTATKGILLLLSYSLGLGLPFILSAILIKQLGQTFDFIKKHYKIINLVSGILLIILGILIGFDLLDGIFE
jgi:cytochrome c-type biogenesis protein